MRKRDANEFTRRTKYHLARSVNYLCSKCGCHTSGPKRGAPSSMTIGKAAHISAASPGGPRYDGSLTPEQRRHYGNGIWMCSNHASLIDEDWQSYSIDQLREMKREAEERAANALQSGTPVSASSALEAPLQWRPPASNEQRAGYAGLQHVAFTLGGRGPQRVRALIELESSAGVDPVRAWISNGSTIMHEHRGLRRGEPCLIPVYTQISQATEFWLDRQIDGVRASAALEPEFYVTDEPFLNGQHRSPLPPGSYRVRAKLQIGDSKHVEEFFSEWRVISVPSDGAGSGIRQGQAVRNDKILKALRELRREVIHEILNAPAPSQDQRGPLAAEWIPRAHDWDARVERAMIALGCEHADIEFVRDFPLPTLRRQDFTYPMNSQWAISDVRREKLEAVIDGLMGRPTFRRL